jgi:hypothetical protein
MARMWSAFHFAVAVASKVFHGGHFFIYACLHVVYYVFALMISICVF